MTRSRLDVELDLLTRPSRGSCFHARYTRTVRRGGEPLPAGSSRPASVRPGPQRTARFAVRPLLRIGSRVGGPMTRTILGAILLIAFTDVALQLDNALAISSVASGVPPSYRFAVLGGGVLLAACCLFGFTLIEIGRA